MQIITKIKLKNFKRFSELEVNFNEKTNVIIGDNESGKSSILQAIELVTGGNRNRVENFGLETLLNDKAVTDFLEGEKTFDKLPTLYAELYFKDNSNPDLVGKHNSDNNSTAAGLKLLCEPNEDLATEINDVLALGEHNFPFEFYSIKFITFNGEGFTGYRKFIKCLTIDSSQISSEYANKEYTKAVYISTVPHATRAKLKNDYRQNKIAFKAEHLDEINADLGEFDFAVRSGSKDNLETDIALIQENIPIDQRGKGLQCFIKTEFALTRNTGERAIDLLLLEEPENHLSHSNMKKLVSKISESHQNQIIIATHSSLMSTRLDLRNSVLLNSMSEEPLVLADLPSDTAKFFMKAPDNNILEFVLSNKVLLVEGDAEYMLMEALYSNVREQTFEEDGVHVISVGGLSFKRYMELAKKIGVKVAVLRDNDGDYQAKCVENYEDYVTDNIRVFADDNDERYTFEVCLYQDNSVICDFVFTNTRIRKNPPDYMLSNKSEAAYRLAEREDKLERDKELDKGDGKERLQAPEYIRQAIAWLNE